MTIFNLFLNFINKMLTIKIGGIDLYALLISITIITIIWSIIKNIGKD